jgi:hypothetical protein
MHHFRSHFGIGPGVIVAIIADTKNNIELKHLLRILCWLQFYEVEHVTSGRWGYSEEVCRDTVIQIASRLQHSISKMIQFGPFDLKRIYLGTIDCVYCETNEYRVDPNSKRYSHKHNGAGVLYEIVVDLCEDKILWTASPKPASTRDITFLWWHSSKHKPS